MSRIYKGFRGSGMNVSRMSRRKRAEYWNRRAFSALPWVIIGVAVIVIFFSV